jgi:lysozyme
VTLADIQRRVGVTPDGVLGPATLAAIAHALGMETARTVSQAGVDLVKEFEGCRTAAYPDPASGGDPWTIGYGATGAGIARGTNWTLQQCEARLHEDLNRFAAGVSAAIGDHPTSQNEFDATVSLAFNIGLQNFKSSTLLRLHQAGDKDAAAGQFSRWNKAAGRVMAGLTRRREAEAALYRGRA